MKINKNLTNEEPVKKAEIGDLIEIDCMLYLVIDYTEKKQYDSSHLRILSIDRLILQYETNINHQYFKDGRYKIICKANEFELQKRDK